MQLDQRQSSQPENTDYESKPSSAAQTLDEHGETANDIEKDSVTCRPDKEKTKSSALQDNPLISIFKLVSIFIHDQYNFLRFY